MRKRLVLCWWGMLGMLLLAGCDNTPPQALVATLTDEPGLVQRVNQRTESVWIDSIPIVLDNTGNALPVTTQIERERATTTTIRITATAELGAEITEMIKAGIALEFGIEEEETVSSRQEFTLSAAADTRVVYVIDWYETWQVGDLQASGLEGEVHYEVRTGIRGDLRLARPDEVPAIEQAVVDVPEGHLLYDDFSSPASFTSWWGVNDDQGLCTFATEDGSLQFRCQNTAGEDRGAALHPHLAGGRPLGVAAAMLVTQTGGPMQLSTNWYSADPGTIERAYQFRLQPGAVEAVECFPLEGWHCESLYRGEVEPGVAHVLQIERQADGPEFRVDGQPLTLTAQPAWSDDFTMRDWNFPFWVWPQNRIIGQLEWVSSRDSEQGG